MRFAVEYIDPFLGFMSDIWSYELLMEEMAKDEVKVLSFTNMETGYCTELQ